MAFYDLEVRAKQTVAESYSYPSRPSPGTHGRIGCDCWARLLTLFEGSEPRSLMQRDQKAGG